MMPHIQFNVDILGVLYGVSGENFCLSVTQFQRLHPLSQFHCFTQQRPTRENCQ
jgi:hypothetical protein